MFKLPLFSHALAQAQALPNSCFNLLISSQTGFYFTHSYRRFFSVHLYIHADELVTQKSRLHRLQYGFLY